MQISRQDQPAIPGIILPGSTHEKLQKYIKGGGAGFSKVNNLGYRVLLWLYISKMHEANIFTSNITGRK